MAANQDSSDPLREIYTKFIQPWIGDFFEINSALCPSNALISNQCDDYDDNKTCCCCCMAPWSGRHYHTTASRKYATGSIRSNGERYKMKLNFTAVIEVYEHNFDSST